MVNRLLVNLRFPRNRNTPTAVIECGCEPRAGKLLPLGLCPAVICAEHTGRRRPHQTRRRASNLARQAKGPEGDLHRSENLLCEQRRNRAQLPCGGRRAGRQCWAPGQRGRSSRGGHVPPGGTGKPCTGQRASELDVPSDSKAGGSWPHHEGNPKGSTL